MIIISFYILLATPSFYPIGKVSRSISRWTHSWGRL